jgi:hypothetical protein
MPAVVDDGQHDVVALLRRPLALLDRLHAGGEVRLEVLQLGRLLREVHLSLAALDLRAGHILLKLLGRHDVHDLAHHRRQLGDVDELGEARDRLVIAGGVLLQLGDGLAERAGPCVELLQPALGQHLRLHEPLQV